MLRIVGFSLPVKHIGAVPYELVLLNKAKTPRSRPRPDVDISE